ncbi:MAG: hypothetical protein K1000chlam3_00821 [Chlamydiae bacterium]|nr:hypothetical protein [Chlamydiota bacterium]
MIFKTLKGKEILSYIPEITNLGITVFREYPHFFENTIAFSEYLSMYANSKNAIVIIAEDDGEVIGVIMSLPLAESMKEIKALFLEKHISMEDIFYFGEFFLLKKYRRKKNGYEMYKEFEKIVWEKGWKKIAFCEIVQQENDPKKPNDYISLDSFWERQGYIKQPELIVHFSWKNIGASEKTPHPMVFWTKNLTPSDLPIEH